MSTNPVPYHFGSIEEWILQQVFDFPHASHGTYTLFQQLNQVFQSEPTSRDVVNELRNALRLDPLPAEENAEQRKRDFNDVERAVETLIAEGWAKGDRNSGVDGVYYTDLKLTNKGEGEAIRRKRERERGAAALSEADKRIVRGC